MDRNSTTLEQHTSPGELVAQLRELPTLPEVAQQYKLFSAQGERGMAGLYRTVLFDPPLAARIMQIAITSKPVHSIGAALKQLSSFTLRQLCDHTTVLKTFDPYAPMGLTSAALWRHSVLTGLLAHNLQVRKQLDGDSG